MPLNKKFFFNLTSITVTVLLIALGINIFECAGWIFKETILFSGQVNWPTTNFYFSFSIIILSISILIFYLKQQKLLHSYTSIKNLSIHLQNIREEERTKISKEIYDELGQQLSGMMMDLALIKRKINPENSLAQNKVLALLDTMKLMLNTVRRIATELRPSVLDNMGLNSAIKFQLEEFNKKFGIHTQLIAPGLEPAITNEAKNVLFRIFQESISNVAMHSNSKNLLVEIRFTLESIIIKIKDTGIGFDINTIEAKKTLGVLGMRERAASIGGKYIIESLPGMGTTVVVKVPVKTVLTKMTTYLYENFNC